MQIPDNFDVILKNAKNDYFAKDKAKFKLLNVFRRISLFQSVFDIFKF